METSEIRHLQLLPKDLLLHLMITFSVILAFEMVLIELEVEAVVVLLTEEDVSHFMIRSIFFGIFSAVEIHLMIQTCLLLSKMIRFFQIRAEIVVVVVDFQVLVLFPLHLLLQCPVLRFLRAP